MDCTCTNTVECIWLVEFSLFHISCEDWYTGLPAVSNVTNKPLYNLEDHRRSQISQAIKLLATHMLAFDIVRRLCSDSDMLRRLINWRIIIIIIIIMFKSNLNFFTLGSIDPEG